MASGDERAALEAENARLRAEVERLRDQERFIDSIVENLPDMVFVKDAAELRFVRFNAAGEALLGHARESLLGRNDYDFFPPEEAAFFVEKDRQVLAGSAVVDIPEEPIHTREGVRWLHTKKIPIRGEDGEPRYLLGISEDISQRKRDAEALAASGTRLRVLLERFPGFVWTMDESLRLTSLAGAHVQSACLALAPDAQAEDCLPRPGPDHDLAALHRAALDGAPQSYDAHHRGRVYEVHLESLPGPRGVVGVAMDVTERRRAEAERMGATLERIQRMESLGLLAGGIAHDFNNLLAAILGNASLSLDRMPADLPARIPLQRVVQSAEAAADLTRQLLAYSGRGRFVVEPVDLGQVVMGISGLLRVSVPKKTELHLELAHDIPRCEVDVAQLRQVVLNLITNAADAVGERGGVVHVSTGVMHADREYLASAWIDEQLPEGRYVWIEVADDGCGMDTPTMNRMFDPFFTTKPRGHGLGLSATLGIVRGHHGALRVRSEAGAGTTVRVLFPVAPEGVARVAPAVVSPAPRRQGRGRVLVVDDEEPIRTFVCDALEFAGYSTVAAVDGRDAVDRFAADPMAYDLVLLDLTMPRLSGEEAFAELRRLRPDARVLLSSGYSDQDAAARFAGRGLAGFLQKPYKARDLLARIDELLVSATS